MKNKKGFTLIELSLSIAFISILLIGIASIVIHMTSIYQKGLTLRAINEVGQQIMEDMTRAVNGASYIVDVSKADENGDGYIDDKESKEAIKTYFFEATKSDMGNEVQRYGALCISNYTYVWNTAEVLNNERKDGVWINGERFRLARFPDPEHKQCNAEVEGTIAAGGGADKVEIEVMTTTNPVDLIAENEVDLALYSFKVIPATQSVRTRQAFISASFILATLRGGVNIMANGDFCQGDAAKGGEYDDYDFDYCAVNKFNFSMRTGGNANREG